MINPSDPAQLRAWAASLAPTRTKQIAVIVDLLQNANTDGMRRIDRIFCRAALELLRGD